MYRSALIIVFWFSHLGQLVGQETKPQESATGEHTVRIHELALADDGPGELKDIAANFRDYVANGKCSIIQILNLTVVDGHTMRFGQSKDERLLGSYTPDSRTGSPRSDPVLQKVQYWLGFQVQLSTKSDADSIRLTVDYTHAFVPDLTTDSKTDDVIAVTAKKEVKLKADVPVAIDAKAKRADPKVDSPGVKRYLVVSIVPTKE